MKYPTAGSASRSSIAVRLSLAFAGMLAFSTEIFSQTAPAPAGDVVVLEEFVATGTRFDGRTVTQSPVPIDVLSARDLKTGGYSEVSQMLQSLIPSFNFPRATVADGTDHIRPATLRGLAPDQTLVLVNGKRRHSSSLVNVNGSVGRGSVSVDFNAFPANIIERIEVLRDGASAQYGSDAIAGVINVILRKDHGNGFNGLWGVTDEGDGAVLDASAYSGMALGEKGTLFVSVFYKDRENTNRSGIDTRQQYFGTNTSGALTNISGSYLSGTSAPPAGITFNSKEATINRRNHRHGDPDSDERGIFFNAEIPLDNGREFYAFGGYTVRDGEASGFFRRSGDARTVRAIYPDGFLPLINSDIADFSLGGGLTGRGGDWDWDISTVFGSNTFDFLITNTANVTIGAASPTSLYAGQLGFDQWTTNIDLRRQINRGDASPVNLALGAEYRWEGYTIKPGVPDSYRDGGVRILDGPSTGALGAVGAQVFPGFRPSDAIDTDRTSYSLYADAETNLSETWLLSGAVRFEDYSDFGTEVTAKIATRVEMSDGFAVRGSVSTGFRAPHLAQQWFSSTATNFIGGVPFENKTFPVTDPVAKLIGAKPLTPETSTNISVGFTYQTPKFSASVDYYNIQIDDRIVLSSNFSGGPIGAFLIANGQPQANGGRYFTNAVDTETKGVDINGRYTHSTDDMGKWTFTVGININDTSVTRFSPTPPQLAAIGVTTPLFDLQEIVRMETSSPDNVINLGVNWEVKKFTFNLRNIRFGEVENLASSVSGWSAAQIASLTPGWDVRLAAPVPGSAAGNQVVIQRFSAKWITDFDVTYNHSDKLSLSAGANNLFDVYPDINIPSNASFAAGDNVGIFRYNMFSPFGFNGAFYYGKIAYKF